MKQINELRNLNNFSKIDSLSSEEIQEWYNIIKNSLDDLSRHYSETEINNIKLAILEYERRNEWSL